jgi:hypothetical protein
MVAQYFSATKIPISSMLFAGLILFVLVEVIDNTLSGNTITKPAFAQTRIQQDCFDRGPIDTFIEALESSPIDVRNLISNPFIQEFLLSYFFS